MKLFSRGNVMVGGFTAILSHYSRHAGQNGRAAHASMATRRSIEAVIFKMDGLIFDIALVARRTKDWIAARPAGH
jgi:hypothetical protein